MRQPIRLPEEPVSDSYGFDRGTPVDRHYIGRFLDRHAAAVRGDVAEVKDDAYTRRYGTGLRSVTVVDIDPANPAATLVADLTAAGSLPAASLDCVICTQTAQFLTDPALALRNCRQALRPGGTLLLTAPTVGRLSRSAPEADRWRVTPAGLRELFARAGWDGPVRVTGYGNLRACLAMLVGEAAEEVGPARLAPWDPRYPLLACAAAYAPPAP